MYPVQELKQSRHISEIETHDHLGTSEASISKKLFIISYSYLFITRSLKDC